MRAADLLFWLWRALLAGRSRSLLSALGIAIGIASVTLLTVSARGSGSICSTASPSSVPG